MSKIIDFHTHIYPQKIAAKAVASVAEYYTIPIIMDGTPETLINSGRHCGIGHFVVFSAAIDPDKVKTINDYIADECRTHSEFTGFGTLHPDFKNPQDEIERIISLGLKGIKFHPDMQKFNIDDKQMFDTYAMLESRNLPVIFHTGDYRFPYSHPSRLANVLDNFPKLCAIAAHFGGWTLFDIAYDCLKEKKCYFDISSSISHLGIRRAGELIRAYGAERILFGTDYPMWDPKECLKEFLQIELSKTEQELILWKNAQKILGIND